MQQVELVPAQNLISEFRVKGEFRLEEQQDLFNFMMTYAIKYCLLKKDIELMPVIFHIFLVKVLVLEKVFLKKKQLSNI